MNAKLLAKALGGSWVGNGWMARCPAHNDRTPSLSVRDAENGTVLFHCHAGCPQQKVIKELKARALWTNGGLRLSLPPAPHAYHKHELDRGEAIRRERALTIWESALPAAGTLVETYFAARGLQLPPPNTLRFLSGLKHPKNHRVGCWPAMVALVTRGSDDAPLAIHRTFLPHDGAGKAPVEPQKMMLGPCRGGAVRLAGLGDRLMVGEGIETCLAAMQATGRPAWAALSTSGLRTLELPAEVRDVVVLADGDEAGETAARDCARRWKREGRRVRIARPPQGSDFNDMLIGHAPCMDGGAP